MLISALCRRTVSVLCLLGCLLSVCGIQELVAQDWTEFRGPNGTGHAVDARPPQQWSETENIAWKVPIHGRGWSSPVVERGKVWLTTATEDGTQLSVICVAADSGKILHDRVLFTVEEPQKIDHTNSYASCTAALAGDRVYVHFGSSGTACLNAETAETLWQRTDFPCNHWRGAGSSPIVYQHLLIVHFDGYDEQYIVALDRLTGETVWKQDRPDLFATDNGDNKKAYGTPAVFEIAGEPVLISPYAKAAMAYRPLTGEELWWVRFEQHSTANRPLFDGERVFLGTGFGKGSVLAVKTAGARGDVTETHVAWHVNRSMPSKPSQILVDGVIYTIADKIGVISAIQADSGELLWQERLGGTFSASPVYANGLLYFCDEDGKTTLVKPGAELHIVAENVLDEGGLATPAPVGEALFHRTKSHLYRIQNSTPPPLGNGVQ